MLNIEYKKNWLEILVITKSQKRISKTIEKCNVLGNLLKFDILHVL
jgi:hypothetical protein